MSIPTEPNCLSNDQDLTVELSASGLSKRYGTLHAVRDVSFSVASGRALGLLGPNGAGKSTTMLLLAGVLRPDRGRIVVAGKVDPSVAEVRRQIGYAPQAVALYPELSARENLELFGKLYGLRGRLLTVRVAAALELAQLVDRSQERVQRFSGGMQRRLNLAAATVHEPRVLLLDEPTVGVDPQSRMHIFRCIEQLKQRGMSIVYSTHHLEEAERLCDGIAIMDHGVILATGSRDELVQRFGGQSRVEARMDAPPKSSALAAHWHDGRLSFTTDEPQKLVDQLLANQKGATELSVRRLDLEGVFMHLTGKSMRDG